MKYKREKEMKKPKREIFYPRYVIINLLGDYWDESDESEFLNIIELYNKNKAFYPKIQNQSKMPDLTLELLEDYYYNNLPLINNTIHYVIIHSYLAGKLNNCNIELNKKFNVRDKVVIEAINEIKKLEKNIPKNKIRDTLALIKPLKKSLNYKMRGDFVWQLILKLDKLKD